MGSDRADGAVSGEAQAEPFRSPLPDRIKSWKSSPLKEPQGWDPCLQSLTVTISKFDYPAAIFWGPELVLLYNQAWIDAGGIREQGQSQRGSLSPDAWNALNHCIIGGKPSRIASHALLRESEKPVKDQYSVLASPLFSADPTQAKGVIAQMLRIPPSVLPSEANGGSEADRGTMGNDKLDSARDVGNSHTLDSLGVEPSENVPLDEHPFFHRFAEMLPTGLAILDHRAQAVFVNQHFYQLTTHMSDDKSFRSWPQSIHPDDYDRVMGAYQDAFESQTQLRTEFRALGSAHPWRLLLLTPLGDENLKHVSLGEYGGFICSVVDITSEKSAEISQRQTAEEATERKRQQERFIDMVSHEIRNPLSAMVHCIEDINDAITTDEGDRSSIDVEQIREALETINLCISHQKNIVDDVLSFSKLDSSMLALNPSPCRPDHYISKSLQMFAPQFRKHEIAFSYRVDSPYRDLGVDWTMADLSRIGQVLLNLITNAIKFTSRKEGEKEIVCKVSASIIRPHSYPPEVVFFSSEESVYRLDATERPEWGDGEPMYIMVALTDTGIGISQEGQSKLFERFRQATPKTGEIYGGSGLGLNIARKLVQLHGGEIGVSSKEGEGATFGFFFRVKRTQEPKDKGKSGGSSRPEISEDLKTGDDEDAGDEHKDETEEEAHNALEKAQAAEASRLDKGTAAKDEQGRGAKDQAQAYAREDSEASQIEMKREGEQLEKSLEPNSTTVPPEPSASEGAKPVGERTQSGKPQSQDQNQDQSQSLHNRSESRRQTKRKQGDQIHVLLVEDNVINQRIVARKLNSKSFKVTTASNGREAVDAMRKVLRGETDTDVHVVLMDQEMPVMDGNAAARAIRDLERERGGEDKVPILGVSANVREEQLQNMLTNGMDGWITKPYRIGDMVERIGKLLGEKLDMGGGSESGSGSGDGGKAGERSGGKGKEGDGEKGKEGDGGKDKENGKGKAAEKDKGSWEAKMEQRAKKKENQSAGNGKAKG